MPTFTKKQILVALLAVAILSIFAYALYKNTHVPEPEYTGAHAEVNSRADAIESYIRTNLATLSPVPPTLGGTFYVTRIKLLNGTGTVNYEDGHQAYVANFSYSVSDDNKVVSVTSFVLEEAAP